MKLTIENSELLASWLAENNLLDPKTRITYFRNRGHPLRDYFLADGDLVYADNIEKLMEKLNILYNCNDWRLFIDSSKSALKAVLLHN